VGAVIYKNVDYVASVNAAANANPTLASRMRQVANYPPQYGWTASMVNGNTIRAWSAACSRPWPGRQTIGIVVYDLPNRDCSALAGGEFIAQNGFNRYKTEYINPIASAIAQFPNLRVIAVIEPDSLPNLHTNLSFAKCQEANGTGGYRDGVVYALNTLGQYSNFYSYIDIGHHGWLGWPRTSRPHSRSPIPSDGRIRGQQHRRLISNTANTSALVGRTHRQPVDHQWRARPFLTGTPTTTS
jgi:cellulase/cellobiase CelA1